MIILEVLWVAVPTLWVAFVLSSFSNEKEKALLQTRLQEFFSTPDGGVD
jgi:hypothetical protein